MDLFGTAVCDAATGEVYADEAHAVITTGFPRRPTSPFPKSPHEKCNPLPFTPPFSPLMCLVVNNNNSTSTFNPTLLSPC